MTKILITEFINQDSLNDLKKKFEVKYDDKLCENNKELKKIIKDYDGLIVRNKTNVNSSILDNSNSLKFIGRLGVGLDNIDTEYCKNKNIQVQPATGMNADSVAESSFLVKEPFILSTTDFAPALKALKSDAIVTKSKPFSIILVAYSVVPL